MDHLLVHCKVAYDWSFVFKSFGIHWGFMEKVIVCYLRNWLLGG